MFSKDARNFIVDPTVGHLNYDRPLTEKEIAERGYKSEKPHDSES